MRKFKDDVHRTLFMQRGRLAKALAYANGPMITVAKRELCELLQSADIDIDADRDTAADILEVADWILDELK